MCSVASAGSWAGRPVSESSCYVKLPRWGPMRPGPRTSLMLATLTDLRAELWSGRRPWAGGGLVLSIRWIGITHPGLGVPSSHLGREATGSSLGPAPWAARVKN